MFFVYSFIIGFQPLPIPCLRMVFNTTYSIHQPSDRLFNFPSLLWLPSFCSPFHWLRYSLSFDLLVLPLFCLHSHYLLIYSHLLGTALLYLLSPITFQLLFKYVELSSCFFFFYLPLFHPFLNHRFPAFLFLSPSLMTFSPFSSPYSHPRMSASSGDRASD